MGVKEFNRPSEMAAALAYTEEECIGITATATETGEVRWCIIDSLASLETLFGDLWEIRILSKGVARGEVLKSFFNDYKSLKEKYPEAVKAWNKGLLTCDELRSIWDEVQEAKDTLLNCLYNWRGKRGNKEATWEDILFQLESFPEWCPDV